MKQGVPSKSLRSLADLASPTVVRRILELYVAKKGGKIFHLPHRHGGAALCHCQNLCEAADHQLRQLEPFAQTAS